MLVLSRRSNESIMLGTDVEIIILGVEGDNVKLGIQAPKEIDIFRKEVYLAIREENHAANRPLSVEDVSRLFNK